MSPCIKEIKPIGSYDLAETSACRAMAEAAKTASRRLAVTRGDARNAWLLKSASRLRDRREEILEANAVDLPPCSGKAWKCSRVRPIDTRINKRIDEMAQSLYMVASLPDPLGEVVTSSRRPNGLEVRQVRVPLGVIFMIYESRPNVTVDAAALCVKSGNAVILRGGKEALGTNRALHRVLSEELGPCGLPETAVQLVPTIDRSAVGELLALSDLIDLAIPRGGESLIRRVAAEATMPVLKHYQGNCHVYVDARCDLEMAIKIILNAKVQRPGVCNAAETLLVHQAIAEAFLPQACEALLNEGVELRGDSESQRLVPSIKLAEPADWDTEYLDKILPSPRSTRWKTRSPTLLGTARVTPMRSSRPTSHPRSNSLPRLTARP